MFSTDAHIWLARHAGTGAAIALEPLKGATSSSVYLVRAAHSSALVLRVLDNSGWLADEPDLAAHEAAALAEAQRAGLRAPRLVAHAGNEAGFGAPVVLMTFIEGSIELRPANFDGWLAAMADELARIHAHPAAGLAWRFRSWVNRAALAPPAWSSRPAAWERAIQRWLAGPPAARPVFIHRDYHPLNILWQGGAISGVVDWINACRGPAGVDVAHCRTNLAQMYGPPAAGQFLAAYAAAATGFKYDPYWDIDSLLDMALPNLRVYPPWRAHGLDGLTPAVLGERLDAYLESVLQSL